MHTRRAFLALAATAAVTGCQSDSDETSSTQTPTRDISTPTRSQTTPTETDDTDTADQTAPNVAWRKPVSGSVTSRPVLGTDRLFAGTDSGTVASLAPEDGETQWAQAWEDPASVSLVTADGRLLTKTGTGRIVTTHTLHGVDATTAERQWQTDPAGSVQRVLGVVEDTAYVGTTDDQTSTQGEYLHALDLTDGSVGWTAEVGDTLFGTVTGDHIFVHTRVGSLDAVSREGSHEWNFAPEDDRLGPPTVVGDTVAIGHHSMTDVDSVHGFDTATGEQTWIFDDFRSFPTQSVGDQLLVGGENVASLDAETGEPLWRADVRVREERGYKTDISDTLSGVHADGTLYVAGDEVAAISLANGTVEWRNPVDVERPSPMGLLDGQLLVQSWAHQDGGRTLLAFDTTTGAEQWSYTSEESLTDVTVGESRAYAGDGDEVLAFAP